MINPTRFGRMNNRMHVCILQPEELYFELNLIEASQSKLEASLLTSDISCGVMSFLSSLTHMVLFPQYLDRTQPGAGSTPA